MAGCAVQEPFDGSVASEVEQGLGEPVLGYSGEIAHQYYVDPLEIFHGWVDEQLATPPSSACSFGGGERPPSRGSPARCTTRSRELPRPHSRRRQAAARVAS